MFKFQHSVISLCCVTPMQNTVIQTGSNVVGPYQLQRLSMPDKHQYLPCAAAGPFLLSLCSKSSRIGRHFRTLLSGINTVNEHSRGIHYCRDACVSVHVCAAALRYTAYGNVWMAVNCLITVQWYDYDHCPAVQCNIKRANIWCHLPTFSWTAFSYANPSYKRKNNKLLTI